MICFSPPLTIFLTELLAPFVFPGYFVCISVIALTQSAVIISLGIYLLNQTVGPRGL